MRLQLFHTNKDISIRLESEDLIVVFPREFYLALDITSYIGVFLSLGGLTIFLLTRLIFKYVFTIKV